MKVSGSRVLALAALALPLAQAAEGRWEGTARVPGLVVPVVIDLAREGAAWAGTATLPGRGVAGAPLRALEVGADGTVRATLAPGAGGAAGGEASVELRRSADGRSLDGHWRQGGHVAPLALARTGAVEAVTCQAILDEYVEKLVATSTGLRRAEVAPAPQAGGAMKAA